MPEAQGRIDKNAIVTSLSKRVPLSSLSRQLIELTLRLKGVRLAHKRPEPNLLTDLLRMDGRIGRSHKRGMSKASCCCCSMCVFVSDEKRGPLIDRLKMPEAKGVGIWPAQRIASRARCCSLIGISDAVLRCQTAKQQICAPTTCIKNNTLCLRFIKLQLLNPM